MPKQRKQCFKLKLGDIATVLDKCSHEPRRIRITAIEYISAYECQPQDKARLYGIEIKSTYFSVCATNWCDANHLEEIVDTNYTIERDDRLYSIKGKQITIL